MEALFVRGFVEIGKCFY